MQTQTSGIVKNQVIPLAISLITLAILGCLLFGVISWLNLLPLNDKISLKFNFADIVIGAGIYLKTSVDFAIFMGRLMVQNPGWKNRIAIEVGTAIGNALGTILILVIWTFFKEITWLLAIMVFLASLVLFELAYSGLKHFKIWQLSRGLKHKLFLFTDSFLNTLTKLTRPITSKILPDLTGKLAGNKKLKWTSLLLFACSVPFILGLDDFAGYAPLFNIVNVFGFALGVVLAHTLLNIALFISPNLTARAVKNAWVSFIGSLTFVILGLWGLVEVIKLVF